MEIKLPLLSGVLAIHISVLAWVLLAGNGHNIHIKNTDQMVVELGVLVKLRAHEAEEHGEFFSGNKALTTETSSGFVMLIKHIEE